MGEKTLGRIMDVLGNPIDECGPIGEDEQMPIHRKPPSYMDQSLSDDLLETGIKVIDLICPFCKGWKNWIIWRSWSWQNCEHDGAYK